MSDPVAGIIRPVPADSSRPHGGWVGACQLCAYETPIWETALAARPYLTSHIKSAHMAIRVLGIGSLLAGGEGGAG